MAPLMDDDDFVGTLSDNDQISDEEDVFPQPTNGTKRKWEESRKQRPVKKQKNDSSNTGNDDVDSDFEFGLEDGTAELDDFEELVGDQGPGAKKGVDVEEIVARRRRVEELEEENEASAESSVDEEEESEEKFGGFGPGADSGAEPNGVDGTEESGSDSGSGSEDAEDDEDNALPTPHPDDAASDSAADDEEDAAEEEKRNAFFAPSTKAPVTTTSSKSFAAFNLSRPLLKGLSSLVFTTPTPIQFKTIPIALEGKDVVGGAVTGSGKTAAFVIPILERLMFRPRRTPTTRVAILTPTRELALQCFSVAKKLAQFTDITFGQAIGGLNSREQEKQLKLRPDIVIATPGRFIDLERNSASLAVNTVEILVLDEADRMLEEGFADELNEIISKIPKSRQTMLFSATMTSKVDDLVRVGLQRPVRIMVDAQRQTVEGLVQEFVRLRPGRESKRLGYLMYICSNIHMERVIIFFRQKKEAHRVRILFALVGLRAAELHGSMTQEQRIQAIEAFRSGKVSFLLATDLASRGLDIKGIETVVNYEAPQSHEIYLHRVGRTARAGRSGRACTLAAEPDRKVVKAAVKSAKAQGAVIRQRTIDAKDANTWQARIDGLEDEVKAVLREEKEEKALNITERTLTRADNIVAHKEEILARPRRTWFESGKEKERAKERGREVLNGPEGADGAGKREKAKKGRLSNKQKKRLEDRDERREGMWKKGSRAGGMEKGGRDEKGGKAGRSAQKGRGGKK